MKRSNYVGNRNSRNLCPNCFSTLKPNDHNVKECSGDRIESWRNEIEKYEGMEQGEKESYLKELDNPYKFLELVGTLNSSGCNYSTDLISFYKDYVTRIPDPIAVASLERRLKRPLREEELEEGFQFTEKEGTVFCLPFCNFPDDLA